MNRRVLLIGATGVFGSRLASMLAGLSGIELVLLGRKLDRLHDLQAELNERGPAADVGVQAFDRVRWSGLAALRPWLVIDAAGPFQDSDYELALAAVRCGAHYIDLADGRAFVAGFTETLAGAARDAGVVAVTGASSTPALSHAALERLVEGWRRIDDVMVVISPGARAPRGLSVMQAILSYAGRPLRVFDDGRWKTLAGWSGLRRIDMPGLGRRWASICETPDLDLLPQRFAIARGALFMAGLELTPMHLGLWLMSLLVRCRLVPTLRPLARPLRAAAGLLAPFGSDRGGMIVEACGEDADGRHVRSRWALWADANAGPSTPAAPAAALVRALVEGREARRGAFTAAGFLGLDDILRELDGLPIWTRTDESDATSRSLFRRLLGRRFESLPTALQTVHGGETVAVFSGRAVTRAGTHPVARLARLSLGLPRSGACDAQVRIQPGRQDETWTRRFGSARFSSRLVSTSHLGVFEEQFGPLHFAFTLTPTSRGVEWRLIAWSVAGLPLSTRLAPRVHACAHATIEGDYRFRVVAAHPWIGLLFAYRGRLNLRCEGRSSSAVVGRDTGARFRGA